MKYYMVYWHDGARVNGCILVALPVEATAGPLTAADRRKRAVDKAMSKAIAIHDNATFYKVEELADTTGVIWTEEWFV